LRDNLLGFGIGGGLVLALAGAVIGEVVEIIWSPPLDGLLYGAGTGGVLGAAVGAFRGWMTHRRETRNWLKASFRR
jgi:hypothetical protein